MGGRPAPQCPEALGPVAATATSLSPTCTCCTGIWRGLFPSLQCWHCSYRCKVQPSLTIHQELGKVPAATHSSRNVTTRGLNPHPHLHSSRRHLGRSPHQPTTSGLEVQNLSFTCIYPLPIHRELGKVQPLPRASAALSPSFTCTHPAKTS